VTGGFIAVYDRAAVDSSPPFTPLASPATPPPLCTAPGVVAPRWIIKGNQTGLDRPFGLAVVGGELIVANQSAGVEALSSIRTFSLAALTAANQFPAARADLVPAHTLTDRLSGPSFITFDAVNRELFVSNSYTGIVTVYARSSAGDFTFARDVRDKGFNPFQLLAGLALDREGPRDELFIAHGLYPLPGMISVFPRTATGTPDALRTRLGPAAGLDEPQGLAVDGALGALFVANNPRTTTGGSVTVYDRTWTDGTVPPRSTQRDPELFSPVALVLADAAPTCGAYTLTAPALVTVPAGSPATIPITATLVRGAGTVTFDRQAVTGLPAETDATFSPTQCVLSCGTALRITTASTTPRVDSTITVTTSAAMTGASSEDRCTVPGRVSFTLRVTDPPAPPVNNLAVTKNGPPAADGTITSVPPGIECGTRCVATFAPGTEVTLRDGADADSLFSGWNPTSCTQPDGTCRVTATAATTTVSASYDPKATLIVQKNGSAQDTVIGPRIACGDDCQDDFVRGTVVELEALPGPTSTFQGIFPNCIPTDTLRRCRVTLTARTTTVFAVFGGPGLGLTKAGSGRGAVRIEPPGVVCEADCFRATVGYDSAAGGTEVTLTAEPDAGSLFAGWSGCTTNSDRICTVRLTTPNTEITATFDANVRVAVFPKGTASGTVSFIPEAAPCLEPVPGAICGRYFGEFLVTLTARPDPGAIFAGWSTPDRSKRPRCGGSGPCDFRASGLTQVDAYFVRTPQEAFVSKLYLDVFGQTPDPGNVQTLIDALTPPPTLTVSALLDAFFNGPTFSDPRFKDLTFRDARFNGRFATELTPAGYVNVLFRAFLDEEPPDDASPPRCAGADAGTIVCATRAQVVQALFDPLVTRLVAAATFPRGATPVYQNLLGRDPTPAEAQAFAADPRAATLAILGSAAYAGRRSFRVETAASSDDVGIAEDVRLLLLGLFVLRPQDVVASEVASGVAEVRRRGEEIEEAFLRSAAFMARFARLFPGAAP
jgi:hypothetical protein